MVSYDTIRYGTYGMVPYDTIHTIWYDTISYDTIHIVSYDTRIMCIIVVWYRRCLSSYETETRLLQLVAIRIIFAQSSMWSIFS